MTTIEGAAREFAKKIVESEKNISAGNVGNLVAAFIRALEFVLWISIEEPPEEGENVLLKYKNRISMGYRLKDKYYPDAQSLYYDTPIYWRKI